MTKLALIGSRDFAHQIRQFAEETGRYQLVGYFDDFRTTGELEEGLPILGKIDDVEVLYSRGTFDSIFLAAGYNNFQFRNNVFDKLKGKVPFANIIMSDAYVNPTAKLGEGVFIGSRSYIDSDVIIHDNSFLRLDVVVGHNTVIKAHSYFSGVNRIAGYCVIGSRVFLGTGVLIADNISIVDDTWVGIGCVVAKDIEKVGKYISPAVRLIPVPAE